MESSPPLDSTVQDETNKRSASDAVRTPEQIHLLVEIRDGGVSHINTAIIDFAYDKLHFLRRPIKISEEVSVQQAEKLLDPIDQAHFSQKQTLSPKSRNRLRALSWAFQASRGSYQALAAKITTLGAAFAAATPYAIESPINRRSKAANTLKNEELELSELSAAKSSSFIPSQFDALDDGVRRTEVLDYNFPSTIAKSDHQPEVPGLVETSPKATNAKSNALSFFPDQSFLATDESATKLAPLTFNRAKFLSAGLQLHMDEDPSTLLFSTSKPLPIREKKPKFATSAYPLLYSGPPTILLSRDNPLRQDDEELPILLPKTYNPSEIVDLKFEKVTETENSVYQLAAIPEEHESEVDRELSSPVSDTSEPMMFQMDGTNDADDTFEASHDQDALLRSPPVVSRLLDNAAPVLQATIEFMTPDGSDAMPEVRRATHHSGHRTHHLQPYTVRLNDCLTQKVPIPLTLSSLSFDSPSQAPHDSQQTPMRNTKFYSMWTSHKFIGFSFEEVKLADFIAHFYEARTVTAVPQLNVKLQFTPYCSNFPFTWCVVDFSSDEDRACSYKNTDEYHNIFWLENQRQAVPSLSPMEQSNTTKSRWYTTNLTSVASLLREIYEPLISLSMLPNSPVKSSYQLELLDLGESKSSCDETRVKASVRHLILQYIRHKATSSIDFSPDVAEHVPEIWKICQMASDYPSPQVPTHTLPRGLGLIEFLTCHSILQKALPEDLPVIGAIQIIRALKKELSARVGDYTPLSVIETSRHSNEDANTPVPIQFVTARSLNDLIHLIHRLYVGPSRKMNEMLTRSESQTLPHHERKKMTMAVLFESIQRSQSNDHCLQELIKSALIPPVPLKSKVRIMQDVLEWRRSVLATHPSRRAAMLSWEIKQICRNLVTMVHETNAILRCPSTSPNFDSAIRKSSPVKEVLSNGSEKSYSTRLRTSNRKQCAQKVLQHLSSIIAKEVIDSKSRVSRASMLPDNSPEQPLLQSKALGTRGTQESKPKNTSPTSLLDRHYPALRAEPLTAVPSNYENKDPLSCNGPLATQIVNEASPHGLGERYESDRGGHSIALSRATEENSLPTAVLLGCLKLREVKHAPSLSDELSSISTVLRDFNLNNGHNLDCQGATAVEFDDQIDLPVDCNAVLTRRHSSPSRFTLEDGQQNSREKQKNSSLHQLDERGIVDQQLGKSVRSGSPSSRLPAGEGSHSDRAGPHSSICGGLDGNLDDGVDESDDKVDEPDDSTRSEYLETTTSDQPILNRSIKQHLPARDQLSDPSFHLGPGESAFPGSGHLAKQGLPIRERYDGPSSRLGPGERTSSERGHPSKRGSRGGRWAKGETSLIKNTLAVRRFEAARQTENILTGSDLTAGSKASSSQGKRKENERAKRKRVGQEDHEAAFRRNVGLAIGGPNCFDVKVLVKNFEALQSTAEQRLHQGRANRGDSKGFRYHGRPISTEAKEPWEFKPRAEEGFGLGIKHTMQRSLALQDVIGVTPPQEEQDEMATAPESPQQQEQPATVPKILINDQPYREGQENERPAFSARQNTGKSRLDFWSRDSWSRDSYDINHPGTQMALALEKELQADHQDAFSDESLAHLIPSPLVVTTASRIGEFLRNPSLERPNSYSFHFNLNHQPHACWAHDCPERFNYLSTLTDHLENNRCQHVNLGTNDLAVCVARACKHVVALVSVRFITELQNNVNIVRKYHGQAEPLKCPGKGRFGGGNPCGARFKTVSALFRHVEDVTQGMNTGYICSVNLKESLPMIELERCLREWVGRVSSDD